ncbi:flagellin [Seohaeicola saemankumensis]|jgi:flagellin|uniref:flagellin N-terminal helical domain-containing protein n=1 Tax=Seohaeicola TaxID=481178 RepID=UPI0035D01D53|nr:flagellin [Paracoccaceae bacterium]
MSSILTNNGAMVALQTLKNINADLGKTQNMISTGKSVSSAKDNAALWAISKVMESDVKGFKAISSSLSLGQSTVAVARQASETVTDLLTQMKEKIVASQESNVDRGKIQEDIVALRDQITSVTTAAQFNGLNLLSNRENTAGSGSVDILSSLDRAATGVTSSNISVRKQDLGTTATNWTTGTAEAAGSGTRISGTLDAATAVALAGNGTVVDNSETLVIDTVAAGVGFQINISASGGTVPAAFNTTAAREVSYVARDGDTQADVANALANAFNNRVQGLKDAGTLPAASQLNAAVTVGATGAATITFTSSSALAADTVSLQAVQTNGATAGGRLEALNDIDVTTGAGSDSALTEIEGLIQVAINSASAFGSAQGRVDTQMAFVDQMTDALRSGIGTLVDADMEEASARLQALQVQQQLGIQSLSIANQAPQSILSLFR